MCKWEAGEIVNSPEMAAEGPSLFQPAVASLAFSP